MKLALKFALITFISLTVFGVFSTIYAYWYIQPIDDQDYVVQGVMLPVFMALNFFLSITIFVVTWLVTFFLKLMSLNR